MLPGCVFWELPLSLLLQSRQRMPTSMFSNSQNCWMENLFQTSKGTNMPASGHLFIPI